MKLSDYYKKIFPTRLGILIGLGFNVLINTMSGIDFILILILLEWAYFSVYCLLFRDYINEVVNNLWNKIK